MKHIDQRQHIRRQSWMGLLFTLSVLMLLFALASGSQVRSDWSDNQTSSLSPSTLKVLQALDEPIQIKAYFSADLPQPYGQLQQFIHDKLDSYRDVGAGNIGYEMIDYTLERVCAFLILFLCLLIACCVLTCLPVLLL